MPRTKKVKKKDSRINATSVDTSIPNNPNDIKGYLRQIDIAANERMHDAKGVFSYKLNEIDRFVEKVKMQINPSVLKMTIGEFCNKNQDKSQNTLDSTKKSDMSSGLRNRVKNSAAKGMKTPNNQGIPSVPMVTPKVDPNMPISVLRRPNQGECAISLSGSPLLVSGICSDLVASVSVPMKDGRVISILPTDGVEGARIELDPHIRFQLEMLKKNLNKCLRN